MEIQRRSRGDPREIHGRSKGDPKEIQGRSKGASQGSFRGDCKGESRCMREAQDVGGLTPGKGGVRARAPRTLLDGREVVVPLGAKHAIRSLDTATMVTVRGIARAVVGVAQVAAHARTWIRARLGHRATGRAPIALFQRQVADGRAKPWAHSGLVVALLAEDAGRQPARSGTCEHLPAV